MEYKIKLCDACQANLDNEKSYHKLSLNFRSYMNDPNTGIKEEVSTMARNTESILCPECFDIFVDKIEQLLDERSPSKEYLIKNMEEENNVSKH